MTESDEAKLDAILNSPPRKPNWDHWQYQTAAMLWEAAALVFDIDPKSFTESFLPLPPPAYDNLMRMAVATLPLNGLVPPKELDQRNVENSLVDLAQFGVWAARIGYDLPARYPRQVTEEAIRFYGWPWGGHTATLLETMARVAKKLWAPYDPSDPTTAPANE